MDTAKLGTGGSHFSLLVYNKKQNTFFDFDPIYHMNVESVGKLYKNLKGFLVEGSKVEGTICSQQNNGYDCGPYTLLFAEKLIQKIIKGEDISTISIQFETDEVKRCRLNLQNTIKNRIKALGEGNKDSNKHKDKGKDETITSHLHLVTKVMLGKEILLEITTTQMVTAVIKEGIKVTEMEVLIITI